MRKVDLWYYLPPFLKEFLEMREILGAEEPEFQELVKQYDDVLKDNFIVTATERGIARFESTLGIRPDASASLETRRSAVLTKWWDVTPYTLRTLKNRIAMIQGNSNIQISFDKGNPYCIQIVTRLETAGQVDDLAYIIQTMLPANLEVDSANRLEGTVNVGLFYGMGTGMTETLFLTNDLNENVNVPGNALVGMASGFTNVLELY